MAYFIGTSGWAYEHWFNGVFYPKDLAKNKAFSYYQTKFDTVELNVTYYRLLPFTTFDGWYKKSKSDFVFSVKGSRYITQNKKLHDVGGPLDRFIERVDRLQDKAGPMLWQFPPNFGLDYERLESFIGQLPKSYRHAFEFRHKSWFNEQIFRLLKNNNMVFVIADSPQWPLAEEITADFVYVRFHGREKLYGSDYSKEELVEWSDKFKNWSSKGLDIYAYFNNDFQGFAPKNALALKSLIANS